MSDYQIRKVNEQVVEALTPEMPGQESWLARLIAKRIDESQIVDYMNRNLTDLPEPFAMLNMEAAAEHLAACIKGNKKTVYVHDFDADGISCFCISTLAFEQLGYSDYLMIIPDRIKENHGLNKGHVDRAIEFGAETIVTMDNGSSCHEAISYAAENGIQTIVTDHHEVPDPDMDVFLMVNPRNPKDTLGDGDLCGGGIAFLLMQAIASKLDKKLDINGILQICAISTMADVVPLTANNRKIVRAGVELMKTTPIPFVEAACQLHNIDYQNITATDLSWNFAPMLNASSRIEKADYAAAALLAVGDRAFAGANYLFDCNKRRALMLEDVLEGFKPEHSVTLEGCSIYCDSNWHLGLVGLIAGKRAREENKVVGCGTKDSNGFWRISFRSPGEGANLSGAVQHAVENGAAIGGGGHSDAAGSVVKEGMVQKFAQFIENGLSKIANARVVDGEAPPNWWSVEKVEEINRFMQPFGRSNPQLEFVWEGMVESVKCLKEKHLKMVINGVDAIAFDTGDISKEVRSNPVRIYYQPSVNEWNGQVKIQIMVNEIEVLSSNDSD